MLARAHLVSTWNVSNVPMHPKPRSAAAVPLPTPPCTLLSPHPKLPALPPLTPHNVPGTAVSTPLPTTPSHTCLHLFQTPTAVLRRLSAQAVAPQARAEPLIGKGVASLHAQSLLLWVPEPPASHSAPTALHQGLRHGRLQSSHQCLPLFWGGINAHPVPTSWVPEPPASH